MGKYVCKANWSSGQLRITIPKALIKARGWGDIDVFILEDSGCASVRMWRYLDGKSTKGNGTRDKARSG